MNKSNYFSFFDLPIAFGIDEQLLKQKYYENSRSYHPDQFGQETESKQAEMLELTTQNNNAYKTLKNFNSRVQYILTLHNMMVEGEKNTLPATFLGEMMEVNEALMELEFDPNTEILQKTEKQVNDWETQLNQQLQQLCSTYDSTTNEAKQHLILQQIKEVYYKSKYILRLKESLAKFAAL